MFSKFYDLYTEEWYKIVKPYGLIDKILQFVSILIPLFNNKVDTVISYKYRLLNKRYSFISLDKLKITYVEDYTTFADYEKYPDIINYKYVVYGISDTFEMLGCGFTDFTALRGIDYIVKDNVYLFREHPSKYCYTFYYNNKVLYSTIGCVGRKTQVPSVYKDITHIATNIGLCLFDNIIRTSSGTCLNFVDLYLQGIYCSDGICGTVVSLWDNENYNFALLNTGSFIAAHKSSNMILALDKKPVIENIPEYFIINIKDKIYPVWLEDNNINNYPDLKETYPELILAGDIFYGLDLYKILRKYGCNFIKIPYIKDYIYDNIFIMENINCGNRIMYLGDIQITNSLVYASEIQEIMSSITPSTSFSITNIDLKYIY